MKPTSLCCFILAVVVSGCSQLIGPNHSVPEIPLPDRWSQSSAVGKGVPDDWWRLFGDAELNRLEDMALTANQDLVSAMHRVDAAKADLVSARSGWWPSSSVGASTDRSQSSVNAAQIPGFTPPEVNQYRLKSGFSYELDLWGKVRREAESSQASLAATAHARDAVLLRLTGEVAEQYFTLGTLDAEQALLEKTIQLRRESLDLTETRFEGNLTSKSDVTRAQSMLASAEADAADVRRRRLLIEHTLAELCGEPAGTFRVRFRSDLSGTVPSVSGSSPAALLRQRPDIAESERNLAAASAQIGVAMGERLPGVTLNGNLSLESLSLDDLLTGGSRAFSLGPELSLPVFTGGANRAKVRKAQAKHQQAVADYRGTVLRAVKEVEDALTNQGGYRTLAEKQKAHAEAASETIKLSLERYRQGRVNYLEVVEAQREHLIAQRSLVQARGDLLQATVQLMRALGGGWSNGGF